MAKHKTGGRKRSRRKAKVRKDKAANAPQDAVAQTEPQEEAEAARDEPEPELADNSDIQEPTSEAEPKRAVVKVVLWHRVVAALVVVGLLVWSVVWLVRNSGDDEEKGPAGPDPVMEELFDQDAKGPKQVPPSP